MASISAREQPDGSFHVVVEDHGTETTHIVTVPEGLPARLGCEGADQQKLVEESFRFLLEREPSTSIMRRFSLDVIAHYFPEYSHAIGTRVVSRGSD